jgi:biopolymer transport protein ExbD/biopolymer transport protein TolR
MNVTPLVDVVLVLLIIFMVVAPQMDREVPVDLPGIFNPDPDIKGALDPLKVSIAKAGEFHLDEQKYDLDGIVEHLTLEHALDPDRRLVLRADAKLKWGDVRQLFARSQEIGFPGTSLLVGEKHRQSEEAAATAPAGAPQG